MTARPTTSTAIEPASSTTPPIVVTVGPMARASTRPRVGAVRMAALTVPA